MSAPMDMKDSSGSERTHRVRPTMLLPFDPEPFTAPTDRDMLPSERRAYVRSHRTCVFGYARRDHGPAMSVVYYVPTDDGELLVSTMAGRSKAAAVARVPNVSLCILDERWPFTYLQVYADATVDTDRELVVDVMLAVGERMTGQPLGPEARPFVEAMAEQEQRVVLRCRPSSTFAQPPRQPQRDDGEIRLTPWISGSVDWDADDPT
jgi:PPOX class probable F420-dependent enzyme